MEQLKIIKAFGILNRTFISYMTAALSDKDLSYSDSIFLVNIGSNEGTTQEELAHALAIDKAAVARSVKSMDKMGYIKTERSKADKRSKELYLTDTGRDLYQYMQHVNQQWLQYVLSDITEPEMKVFTETIAHISRRARTFSK